KANHIDRLNEEFFDFTAANLRCDAARQARHARKGPRYHRQQEIGDEILVVVATDGLIAPRLKDRKPQENLRDDRQEPHQRAEREIASIDQSLGQRYAKDGPPGDGASVEGGHRECRRTKFKCRKNDESQSTNDEAWIRALIFVLRHSLVI